MTEKEFINKWTTSLLKEKLKSFPFDFLSSGNFEEISLPGKQLVIGEEFFGNFEVLTVDGAAILQSDSQAKAKYIVYSSREKVKSLKIPVALEEIKNTVSGYEKYLDSIIKNIESDYKKNFPGEKKGSALVNEIFRILNLNRY